MKDLFTQRRQAFWQEILRYLPYVFNDHFVLVLMVGLGMGLYHYRQLLLDVPDQTSWLYLGLAGLSLGLLSLGRQASYVQSADKHYLLVKEAQVRAELVKSYQRSVLVWGLVQTGFLLLAYPLWQALGQGWLTWLIWVVLLLALRAGWQGQKLRQLLGDQGLAWDLVISREKNRQGAVRQFFSLFTQVKGLATSVKKRPYLTPLLERMVSPKDGLWLNLYWRAFLRAGDYLGLYSRLAVLALVVLRLVDQPYLAGGLAVLCHFLISFQLIPLHQHYGYQTMLRLAPKGGKGKVKALHNLLRQVNYGLLVLDLLVAWRLQVLAVLLVGVVLVVEVYLPIKLKTIDEVT